jgi:hypothetical protein
MLFIFFSFVLCTLLPCLPYLVLPIGSFSFFLFNIYLTWEKVLWLLWLLPHGEFLLRLGGAIRPYSRVASRDVIENVITSNTHASGGHSQHFTFAISRRHFFFYFFYFPQKPDISDDSCDTAHLFYYLDGLFYVLKSCQTTELYSNSVEKCSLFNWEMQTSSMVFLFCKK